MRTVAIFGVGLIGGSFALALRRAGFAGEILGVSSESTVTEAVSLGVIDRGVTLQEAAAGADLIYLAQPIRQIIQTIADLSPHLKSGALVTDAGSTKAAIGEQAKQFLPPGSFLGGHPMAGKAVRGVAAADAALFEGRTYFLTAQDDGQVLEHPVAKLLLEHVARFGARAVRIDALEHDRLVSLTSHLPQLASTALASALTRLLDQNSAVNGAGPGLIDMTRLAQSSYELWADILLTNSPSIDQALGLYISELQQMREILNKGELGSTFEHAANFAAFLRKPPH